MQDVAREITALLEPSEPLGYRLVMYCPWQGAHSPTHPDVAFEAKAVPFKDGHGFLVRCVTHKLRYCERIPPVDKLPTMFAPTNDALKSLIRMVYNMVWWTDVILGGPRVILMPPHYQGHESDLPFVVHVDFHVNCTFEIGEFNSIQEQALRETVAMLTLMRVPEGLKW